MKEENFLTGGLYEKIAINYFMCTHLSPCG